MTKCQNNSELPIIKHKNHAVQACNHAIVHNQVTKREKELAPETSDPLVIIFPWYWDSILVLPTAPVLSHTHWQCKLTGFDPRLLDPFFHHIPSYSIIFCNFPQYHGIWWNMMEYCAMLWENIMVNISKYSIIFYHIPSYSIIFRNFPQYHGISWNMMEYCAMLKKNIMFNISQYSIIFHHIPSYSIIFHPIPSYSIIFHHIPSYSIIFHHIP